MAQVPASRRESLGQLRRLDRARRLEKESRENKSLEETEIVGGEDAGGERFKAPRRPVDGEHGALAEEGIDAHKRAAFAGLAESAESAELV